MNFLYQRNSKAVILGTFANKYYITMAILGNSRAVDLKNSKAVAY